MSFFSSLLISSLAAAPVLLLSLISCRSDEGRVFWVDETRKVRIELKRGSTDLSSYILHLIGPDGTRTAPDKYSFSGESLEFSLDNDYILKEPKYSFAETVVAMGDQLPAYPERSVAVARVEIYPPDLPEISGKVSYTQFSVPLLQSDILAASQAVNLKEPVKLREVSYQKIRVVDFDDGTPLTGASIAQAISGSLTVEVGVNIPAWQGELYRPVTHLTDSEGHTVLIPLTHEFEEKSRFSVIAWAEGYCTYVSGEMALDAKKVPDIKLKKCPDADLITIGFKTSYAKDYNVLTEQVNGEETSIAYVNERKISLRIDSLSPVIRGIKVRVTEEHKDDGEENPAIPEINFGKEKAAYKFKFFSELTVDIPLIFSYNNIESGDLIINVFTSSADGPFSLEEVLVDTLYLRKSTVNVAKPFSRVPVIKGSLLKKVISGRSGTKFFVESQDCQKGMEFGLQPPGGSIIFSPCSQNVAVFEKDSFPLINDLSSTGGSLNFRMFIKDKYRNVSKDDPAENTNKTDVFVDYGTPDLSTSPLILGAGVGFAQSGATKGTDLNSYIFPAGTLTGGTSDTVIIKPDTSGSVVFRAASPSDCKTNAGENSSEDATFEGSQGLRIEKMILSATESTSPDDIWYTCTDSTGVVTDIPVTGSMLNFPDDASANAYFYLKVMDSAGHESAFHKFEIPSCPENVETEAGTSYCWKK